MSAYRRKTVGAALAAVLLVGGATACQDGKDAKKDNGAASAPSKAAQTPATQTPVAETPVAVTPAAFLEKTKKKSEEITSLRYAMSGTAAGQSISGEAAMRLKPTVAMSMTMAAPEAPGQKIEIRLLDGALYLGSGSKWMKFDMKTLAPEEAKQLDALGGQQGENPGDKASDLSTAKDLKTVGEETVDGQKTTHLTGTVTLDQLKAQSTASTPEAKARHEKNLKALEDQGVKELAMDIWIDEADQTKQFRTRGQGTSGPMDVAIKFLDINKPVEVTAPPADQVVDLAAMMDGKGEGTG
ncbi:LppX_LprAFG lipoprotein [Streptomyces sp. NBC_01408]|uniref:LppX_LprAFG lipoprotein n=1 Tax=Streptomyces sp. NBC_01408 TaxID=2903855 RepID=UPI002253362B|nr:LppX_LprAFG lipoprotein [Streptomyces sp. NBC_01408]MCX4691595.1 LppX_LprAFG lipoprotein [Streptomyces sp. NBC_01408]